MPNVRLESSSRDGVFGQGRNEYRKSSGLIEASGLIKESVQDL
jgi:hypothetical protein